MRTNGIIVHWHGPSQSGLIRSAAHALPHLFRQRDLRSDCPLPVVGMAVQFESVQLDGHAPRALAVAASVHNLPLPEPEPPRPPDAVQPRRPPRRLIAWRSLTPQLGALAILLATGWWLWTHPLA